MKVPGLSPGTLQISEPSSEITRISLFLSPFFLYLFIFVGLLFSLPLSVSISVHVYICVYMLFVYTYLTHAHASHAHRVPAMPVSNKRGGIALLKGSWKIPQPVDLCDCDLYGYPKLGTLAG